MNRQLTGFERRLLFLLIPFLFLIYLTLGVCVFFCMLLIDPLLFLFFDKAPFHFIYERYT